MPYVYQPTRPHQCATPLRDLPRIGAIWQCSCGQHFRYQEGFWADHWKRISPDRVKKILAKILKEESS